MAKFIKCCLGKTKYREHEIVNSPVNIDLVTQVQKIQEKYYPDNEGVPAIKFNGINVTWVYGKEQLSFRDKDYEKIINNEF